MKEGVLYLEIGKLINVVVIHKSLGEGSIKSVDQKYLSVEFENGKISRFIYPACFDEFLTIKDKRKQNAVEKDVAIWREESGKIQQEEMRLQYQRTQETIVARRAAAEERKLQAARRSNAMRIQHMTSANKKN